MLLRALVLTRLGREERQRQRSESHHPEPQMRPRTASTRALKRLACLLETDRVRKSSADLALSCAHVDTPSSKHCCASPVPSREGEHNPTTRMPPPKMSQSRSSRCCPVPRPQEKHIRGQSGTPALSGHRSHAAAQDEPSLELPPWQEVVTAGQDLARKSPQANNTTPRSCPPPISTADLNPAALTTFQVPARQHRRLTLGALKGAFPGLSHRSRQSPCDACHGHQHSCSQRHRSLQTLAPRVIGASL
mmetsp:Transcript_38449/g.90762  ORF Transcript_38449/g.90762 Transcript_38449/m.90762 type:complete len:248 (-) Transcript_38449:157-900(-)